ncbi:ABC transporter substrate-binding protein [Bacillus massiliigorillae]|uniref:ABC transporter substrate-binding protein n=1 Tax=Bacillus massiliigorillae TaxID=1243664 RepID=UPI0003A4A2C4|nr:ABC transporter substrate-binding protein [Bacillus massiliigorillae]
MRGRKFGFLIIMFALMTFLAACNNDEKASTKEGTKENAKYKEEINVAVTAQPPTLDSAVTVSAVALDITGNIFEQLYTLNADYEPTPMLAESVDVSKDGLTYTFKLREGIKFHNGKEMTSEDVEASMNYWLKTSSRAKTLLEGAKFTAADKYNVKLTVKQASSDVLILMSSQAQFPSIMPKEIIEGAGPDGVKEYIGTGPYKFVEWKQDQYIHLTKYDGYQSVDSKPSGFAGKKEAPTKDLFFHFVTDHATRIAGVQSGQYDLADSIPNENYDQLDADKNVKLDALPNGTLTAFFNTNQGLLANEKYRQAILAALNNDEIMLASFAKPDLYSLDASYMNPKQTQWATNAGKEYYNQADTKKAKKLLKEAGYKGEQITLLTTKDYAEMYSGTLVIQEQLSKIGMNVKVENFDFPTFLETKNDPSKWDIFLASTGYQLTPAQLLPVTPDWAGLNNTTVKEGLAAIRGAASQEEAKAEWEKVQAYLYKYGSSSVLGHYYSVVATTNKMEGFELFEAPIVWNAKVKE